VIVELVGSVEVRASMAFITITDRHRLHRVRLCRVMPVLAEWTSPDRVVLQSPRFSYAARPDQTRFPQVEYVESVR
jgi:hypothetical protein